MMKRFIVCERALVLFACIVLAFWACGSDDDSVGSDWEDTELSSGSNGDGGSSGSNLSGSSRSSSSGNTPYSAVKINYSASDSNGTVIDSRDSTVYGTLRIGPYIWMSSNVSGNIYGVYNVCYNGDTKNCDKYGRLFVGNSGSVCPPKFRLPTRSELKNIKSDSRIALQYGGMCKKLDELECKGLDSEAYYQVNDGSIFVDYGGESVLFKNSADYNFYSVRCLAFTHIVYKKNELPVCDSALAVVNGTGFYVSSLDSGYTCTNKGWSLVNSSYRRSCSGVIDTMLTYAMGDSVFTCRAGEWRLATLQEMGTECNASRNLQIVEFNGDTFYCMDSTWKKMTYPSTELGICHPEVYKKIALTDKGDRYVCDTSGWRIAQMTDIIGVCDSTKRGTLADYSGKKYVCDATGWRQAKAVDVLGSCDSTKYGKTGEFSGTSYLCAKSNIWRELNAQDKMFGICSNSLKDAIRMDTTAKKIYKCTDSLTWISISATTYLSNTPCSVANQNDTVYVFGSGYVCRDSAWKIMSTQEMALGICTEERLDEIQMLSSTYYSCKTKSTKPYSWYVTDSLEFTLGVCPSKGNLFVKAAPSGALYTCSSGFWSMTTISDILGACTGARGVIDTVYDGVEYVCDTSFCGGRNPMWHMMQPIDSIVGYCKRELVGTAIAFKDTVYVCASVDVFSDFAYTQAALQSNHFSARRQWSLAPDSIAKAYRKQELEQKKQDFVDSIGECTAARVGTTFKNEFLDMTCTSTGWLGKTTTFTDSRDGQVYRQTTIGTQTWMVDNLRYKPSSDTSWCPNNVESNCSTLGRLYQWHTAVGLPSSADSAKVFYDSYSSYQNLSRDTVRQGICPTGWRVPLYSDLKIMKAYILDKLPALYYEFFGFVPQYSGYMRYWKQNGIDKMTEYIKNSAGFWLANDTDAASGPVYWLSFGDGSGVSKKYDGVSVRCVKE